MLFVIIIVIIVVLLFFLFLLLCLFIYFSPQTCARGCEFYGAPDERIGRASGDIDTVYKRETVATNRPSKGDHPCASLSREAVGVPSPWLCCPPIGRNRRSGPANRSHPHDPSKPQPARNAFGTERRERRGEESVVKKKKKRRGSKNL